MLLVINNFFASFRCLWNVFSKYKSFSTNFSIAVSINPNKFTTDFFKFCNVSRSTPISSKFWPISKVFILFRIRIKDTLEYKMCPNFKALKLKKSISHSREYSEFLFHSLADKNRNDKWHYRYCCSLWKKDKKQVE